MEAESPICTNKKNMDAHLDSVNTSKVMQETGNKRIPWREEQTRGEQKQNGGRSLLLTESSLVIVTSYHMHILPIQKLNKVYTSLKFLVIILFL